MRQSNGDRFLIYHILPLCVGILAAGPEVLFGASPTRFLMYGLIVWVFWLFSHDPEQTPH
jgi:hypothetical protein